MSSLSPFSSAVGQAPAATDVVSVSLAQRAAASFQDYSQLFKLRVTAMILLTAWCGAYWAATRYIVSPLSWDVLGSLLAIGFVAAGTAAMNEIVERDVDARMLRTAMRPLVTGRISRSYALAISLTMILGSIVYLALATNRLTAGLALLTSVLYLGAYTPLKKVHPVCTTIGAVPGAMPAVLGWTAVRGRIDLEALALFGIVFLWQFPHFHAIALLYRDDYKRAGIRMLPVVEPEGTRTIETILLHALALIPVSFLPALFLSHKVAYVTVAFLLGLGLFWYGLLLWRALCFRPAEAGKRARQLLIATVVYIPALLIALLLSIGG